ncbi:MAG TPA: division plane positioning ATPase MipZ [Xanthobacteraceae bacterium]|nr:division plane positioning ATPase MipZ [Xanthobacteraceae bacterium]
MSVPASTRRPVSAHVIVLGNEKGGSGKSTLAMHVAAALMSVGQRVATIDLDSRQKSFTRYVEFRRDWAKRTGLDLKIPTHACIARGSTLKLDDNEAIEAVQFADAISGIEQNHDFVVIDTPGADTHLARLAHSLADTLITPLNDSFVDFDVLGTLDPINMVVTGEGPYAQMVRDARRRRREIDFVRMDWVVVRNRMSQVGSRRDGLVGEGLEQLAARLGFRCLEGFAERLIYRELFPRGLTALDPAADSAPGAAPGPLQLSVQQEVLALVEGLNLPLNDDGRRRAAARREWFAARGRPLEMHDFIGA